MLVDNRATTVAACLLPTPTASPPSFVSHCKQILSTQLPVNWSASFSREQASIQAGHGWMNLYTHRPWSPGKRRVIPRNPTDVDCPFKLHQNQEKDASGLPAPERKETLLRSPLQLLANQLHESAERTRQHNAEGLLARNTERKGT